MAELPGDQLHQDALVGRLRPVADVAPTDMIMLQGFLGNSPSQGEWRLYLTPNLSTYVDIKKEDILHAQQIAPEQNPLGGTTLWVRPSAMVGQEDFLRGVIAGMAMGRPRGGGETFIRLTPSCRCNE